MIRYKIDHTFPTSIIQFDYSDSFTKDDQKIMTDYIDNEIVQGRYEDTPYHPKYQTKGNLFKSDSENIWKKLELTFIESCRFYLDNIENFSNNQNSLQVSYVNAWAYKNWKSLNATTINPWHNHNPAFLSGIFYLKIPGDQTYGGTEFGDPRLPDCHGCINFMSVPMEFTWSIFPAWLRHRTVHIDSEECRYVIASNLYCAPKHD
jgi:hypothetical protein